ncbi:hypothetical protein Btru_063808 [Bulinus truncatus]|nr:hypothetical protein Btru_063808 [Bulinus truncatus]
MFSQRITCFLFVTSLTVVTFNMVSGGFNSSPKSITPHKTRSMSLRCEPEVGPSSSVLAIFIRKQEDPSGSGNDTGAVKQTGSDIASAPAPQDDQGKPLMKNSDSFARASITVGNKISVFPMLTRFLMDGTLTDSPPYLMVSVQSPDVDSLGEYMCQSTYMNELGEMQFVTYNLRVEEEVPLTVEVIQLRVKTLETQFAGLKFFGESMAKTAQDTKNSIQLLQKEVEALKQQNSQLSEVVAGLTNEMRALSSSSVYRENNGVTASQGQQKNGQGQSNAEERNEEMSMMKDRLQELENTRIHVLEEQMQYFRDRQKEVENLAAKTDLVINSSLEPRVKDLEKFNWKVLWETLEDIEGNVTQARQNITQLQDSLKVSKEMTTLSGFESKTELPSSIPETPVYDGPACYVCGDNETQKACSAATSRHTEPCPKGRPVCVTSIYQNGTIRNVYKGCVSELMCLHSMKSSDPRCMKDSFMDAKAMKCVFCCKSPLCNDYLKPESDLVT